MRKILFSISFVVIVLIIFSCSEENNKFEVYNSEAFAFQVDNEWELNASAQVKGFTQVEENDEYLAKLSYYVNLITPSGEELEEIDYGMIDRNSVEKLTDTQIEIQVILDSSFVKGEYALKIFVVDDYSEQQSNTETKFSL